VWEADVNLFMRSKEAGVVDYVSSLFVSGRELCCCPPEFRLQKPDWIVSVTDLRRNKYQFHRGSASRRRFLETRRLAATIHDEMIRSFRSSRRKGRGELEYVDSDVFFNRLLDLNKLSRGGARSGLSIRRSRSLDDAAQGRLYRAFGDLSLEDVLRQDGVLLARTLEMDEKQVAELKARLLDELVAEDSDKGDR
jgi:hypothetical protein